MAQTPQDPQTPDFAELLLDSMADGVFTLDKQGHITRWNPAMERISGYAENEALGKPCTILSFNRCLGQNCPAGFAECGILDHGNFDGKECFLRHKDGHDVSVLKSARLLLDRNGTVTGVVETVTDLADLYAARRELEQASRRLKEMHSFDNIIGKSSAMGDFFTALEAAAASEATVLIQGESGTGKELAAIALHFNGSRSEMPFVPVNCSALSESLLESELFGHIQGAFTGAIRDRIGRVEQADGGTLFLDEVGEISPLIQLKLLRVLQEREIERVGESKKRKIDIRIIAATNKDLFYLVEVGKFRQDLFYRLKVFPITLPPLRKRKEDLQLLISHFIARQNEKTGRQVTDVTPAAMRILFDYPWPGNVRELENAIEHAFVLVDDHYIDVFDLPVELRQFEYRPGVAARALPPSSPLSRKQLTRQELVRLLEEAWWNKAEVARRLGVSRTAVWKYMKKWDIPLKKPGDC